MTPLFMLLSRAPIHLNEIFHTTWFTDELYFLGVLFAGRPFGADSYFALIVPLLFSPYGTFLLRQFFVTIPRDLDEAAMLDGCSRLQTLCRVLLPLATPGLATLGTFTFMASWGNFLWPLIMTNAEAMRTLPVGLAGFMGEYETKWPLMMAGAMMTLLPMIVVFIACQRFFVRGIQLGALKG